MTMKTRNSRINMNRRMILRKMRKTTNWLTRKLA